MSDSLTRAALTDEIQKIRWFHCIDLGNGIVTPGIGNQKAALKKLRMPDNLEGRTVLDIGAWDGFYAFEAERRGAARVLATDYYCWGGAGWGSQDGFNLARRVLNSRVEDREIDVLDLCPEAVGTFDLVLFLGVLYHLRDPLRALERVASVTANQLILETHVDMLKTKRPAMAFYPGNELCGDPTNWWGPNLSAVVAMLRTVGFRRVEIVAHPERRSLRSGVSSGVRWLAGKLTRGGRRAALSQVSHFSPRAVFHAWK